MASPLPLPCVCGDCAHLCVLCFAVIRAKVVSEKEVGSGNDVYGNPIKRIQYEIKQIKVRGGVGRVPGAGGAGKGGRGRGGRGRPGPRRPSRRASTPAPPPGNTRVQGSWSLRLRSRGADLGPPSSSQMFKGPDRDIEFIYTAPSSAICGVSLDVGGKKEYLIAGACAAAGPRDRGPRGRGDPV